MTQYILKLSNTSCAGRLLPKIPLDGATNAQFSMAFCGLSTEHNHLKICTILKSMYIYHIKPLKRHWPY